LGNFEFQKIDTPRPLTDFQVKNAKPGKRPTVSIPVRFSTVKKASMKGAAGWRNMRMIIEVWFR